MTTGFGAFLRVLASPLASFILIIAALSIAVPNFSGLRLPGAGDLGGTLMPLIGGALVVKLIVFLASGGKTDGFNGYASFLLCVVGGWLLGHIIGRWTIEADTPTAYSLSLAVAFLAFLKVGAMMASVARKARPILESAEAN